MNVRLVIHLDPSESEGSTWWIESPEVQGFTGAADSLQEARVVSERALRDILGERGDDEVTFSYEFAASDGSAGEEFPVRYTRDGGADEELRNSAPLRVRVA